MENVRELFMGIEDHVPAYLQLIDLQPADLQPADLQSADLQSTDLQPTDLQPDDSLPANAQEKINNLLERLEDIREKMETETQTFIEATKQFTLAWTRREIEMAILSLENNFSFDNLESDQQFPF